MSRINLFEAFSEVSSKAWKQKIQAALKGADYNESLIWESPEGIPVKPFYHAEDLESKCLQQPGPASSWKIGQHIFTGDPKDANATALDALNRGAESLYFTVPSEDINLKVLLKDIDLKTTAVHFNFQFLSTDYLRSATAILCRQNTAIHLNIDPIGRLVRTGNWFINREKDFEMLAEISGHYADEDHCCVLGVDIAHYQNAGANAVQQLAYGLAQANEYMNALYNKKTPGKMRPEITFKIAMAGNYFFEIAKLRALRLLWNTLAQEYGLPGHCHILAAPSKRNKTLYEHNANMLRTTMECMSGILGGADTVCNLPYDALYHKDNEFAERIARNQLLILKNESHFDKVLNAADGSYYIERLTRQLADKSLRLFKSIEAGGGLLQQLKNHTIQKKISESAQKEQQLFNEGKEVLVGSNAYQNPEDRMNDALERYPFMKTKPGKTLIAPIVEKRLAEAWEQERLKYEM